MGIFGCVFGYRLRTSNIQEVQRQPRAGPLAGDQRAVPGLGYIRRPQTLAAEADVGGVPGVGCRDVLDLSPVGRHHGDAAVHQGGDADPPVGFHRQAVEVAEAPEVLADRRPIITTRSPNSISTD